MTSPSAMEPPAAHDIRITDVIAHPLTQRLPQPTVTSWGRYDEVSIVLVEIRTDAGITGIGTANLTLNAGAGGPAVARSLRKGTRRMPVA